MGTPGKKYIVHVDMDAFFAAIEERDNPAYKGKPVIVGSDPKEGKGRGVVSTASYEARKYGIHSAMPISTAYKKCPNGIFLPVDFAKYERESAKIMRIFDTFTPYVEPVSIDEAFLDISDTYAKYGTPRKLCEKIKDEIRKQLFLTASVGLAPNKMTAKIASGHNKPDGLVEVKEGEVEGFLRPLRVESIWGIGEKTKTVLNNMGIFSIGDLAAKTKTELVALFGKNGDWFWEAAHGIDDSVVTPEREVKSISNETTFDKDVFDKNIIERELSWLSEVVSDRLRDDSLTCKTIALKIRFEDFETHTKQITLKSATRDPEIVMAGIKKIFDGIDLKGRKVRLVGVRAFHLAPGEIGDLLHPKKNKVQNAVDNIRTKFGRGSIFRASSNPPRA